MDKFKALKRDVIIMPLSNSNCGLTELQLLTAIEFYSSDFFSKEPYIIPVKNLNSVYFISSKGLKIQMANAEQFLNNFELHI